jgi:uncharacterized protein YggE
MNSNNPLYEIFGNGAVRIALTGALAILALYLLAQTITTAANFGRSGTPATDTITVQGDGQATMPPDVARVSFTVQNTSPTVVDAQAATTKQANAAIDYVKGQGIADKDVKTLSYNISPQYSYPSPCPIGALCTDFSRAPKVIGYQVSETVEVKMHDLTAVGTMLGGLGQQGVQNLNGPAFALDDPTAGFNAARADAIDNAKTQAMLLASQLGVRLGKIVNFSESNGGNPTPFFAMSAGASFDSKAAPAPSVPVGENTYNANVSITYEIR